LQDLAGKRPLERFRHRPIEVMNKCENLLLQVLNGGEVSSTDESANQDAEPYLNLVQSETVFGRIHESNSMGEIGQKGSAAFFGLENALLPFDAQRGIVDAAVSRHEANDAHRTMSIELIGDQYPFTFRVLGKQLFHVPYKIFFRSCIAYGRFNQLTGGNLQVCNETLCTVPHVLEFSALHQSRFHRQCRMETFQRLNAGHFVDANDMNADLMENRRILVRPTNGTHLAHK
jgi:hypothetical protein